MDDTSDILFWLVPFESSRAAAESLEDPENQHLLSTVAGAPALAVALGPHCRNVPPCILTLGRGRHVDIVVNHPFIASCQLKFEISPDGELVLCDTSELASCSLQSQHPHVLDFGSVPRETSIKYGDLVALGMGGEHRNLVQFHIVWPPENPLLRIDALAWLSSIHRHPRDMKTLLDHGDDLRTYTATILSSCPGETIAYRQGSLLGRGTWSKVVEATISRNGRRCAVKIIDGPFHSQKRLRWRQHIVSKFNVMRTLNFPHVVKCIHAQGIDSNQVEIFMEPFDSNVSDLLLKDPTLSADQDFLKACLQQTLSALVYLHHNGHIHGNIKPQNLLVKREDAGKWRFAISDLGLSKYENLDTVILGFPPFMAPESGFGSATSSAADLFSLARTLLFILDSEKISEVIARWPHERDEILREQMFASVLDKWPQLSPLLHNDPLRRPTARDFYLREFGYDSKLSQMYPRCNLTSQTSGPSLLGIPRPRASQA